MDEGDPEDQQHPRRVYRSVWLPASVFAQIHESAEEARASRAWRQEVDQWRGQVDQTLSMLVRQVDRAISLLVASDAERRASAGLRPFSEPGAGTQAGTSSQQARTSTQQK